jgi:O-antigen/teichoic acid export membrane protein
LPSRVSLNFVANVLAQLVNKLFPLVMYAVAQTRLTTIPFGQALFAVQLLDWTSPFIEAGTTNYGQIEVGAASDAAAIGRATGAILGAKLCNAAMAAIGLAIWVALRYPEHATTVRAISFMIVTGALDASFVLVGTQRVWWMSVFAVVSKVAALAAVFLAVRGPDDATAFAVVLAGANGLFSLATFALVARVARPRLPSFADVARVYRRTALFALTMVLIAAMDKYDLMLVEARGDPTELGLYGGATRPFVALQSIIPAFVLAFGAEMLRVRDRDAYSRQAHLALGAASFVAFAIAAGVWFVASGVLTQYYDPSYAAMGTTFSAMCLGCVPQAVVAVYGVYVLSVQGRTAHFCLALALGLLLGIGASWPLGNALGVLGIAWSLTAAKSLTAALALWWGRGLVHGGLGAYWWRNLGAAAGMLIVLLVLPSMPWMLTVLVGGGVYLGLVAVLNRTFLLKLIERVSRGRPRPSGAPLV